MVSDWGLTDLGNADRLVAAFAHVLRYCPQTKRWYTWDGVRWAEDWGGARVIEFAKSTVRGMGATPEVGVPEDKLSAHAVRSESDWSIQAMVRLARTDERVRVMAEHMDSDPWMFNVANGVVDLRTGALTVHAPDGVMHTKCAGVEYNPRARCPRWEQFLLETFANNAEMVQYIQRAVGYSLTGSTREQVVFFCYGVGNNGKSTLLEAVRGVMGDYAANTNASTFMQKSSGAIRNDIARLQSKRYVTATEVAQGKHLDEVVVKQLTGEDMTTARFLYSEEIEFRPQFKIWMAGNHKPAVSGTDHAIWRRMRLLPFDVVVSREHRDQELPGKLRAEAEGILAWAVRGALEWRTFGLGMPKVVEEATLKYREEMDGVGFFMVERCVVHPTLTSAEAPLYDAYVQWAYSSGENPMPKDVFWRKLTERSGGMVKRIRSGGSWQLRGIDIAKKLSLRNLIEEGDAEEGIIDSPTAEQDTQ